MRTKFFVLVILSAVLFTKCSVNDSTSANIIDFIGDVGTTMTYVETEYWLDIETDAPIITVPENFVNQVSLNSDQLAAGTVAIKNYILTVNPPRRATNENWEVDSPISNYIQVDGGGDSYNLADELIALQAGNSYSSASLQYEPVVYYKSDISTNTIYPPSISATHPSTPYVVNAMQVGDSWIREQVYQDFSTNVISETKAEVVAYETITVAAGTFDAYKIKLTLYQYGDSSYMAFDLGYEYFTPNIGLVRKTFVGPDIVIDPFTEQQITVNKIINQELVDVAFIADASAIEDLYEK